MIADVALPGSDQNHQFQKCPGFLSHGGADPANVVLVRGDHQGRRNRNIELACFFMVQSVLPQSDAVGQLTEGANYLAVGLGEDILLSPIRKKQKRYIVRHLRKSGSQLLEKSFTVLSIRGGPALPYLPFPCLVFLLRHFVSSMWA